MQLVDFESEIVNQTEPGPANEEWQLRLKKLACALAIAALLPLGMVGAGDPFHYEFEPDPTLGVGARLDGKVWIVESERFIARVAMLDDAARRRWLTEQAGVEIDPFASPQQAPLPSFFTFLLDIERRGKGSLQFDPRGCPVATFTGELRYPLDMDSIETAYRMQDKDIPPAYDALRKVLLDRQQVLAPGGRVTGLLAYTTAKINSKILKLEVRMTSEAGDPLKFEVGYQRVKIKDEPAKK